VKAVKKMQEFVIGISNYARKQEYDFIIILQNGSELAFENSNPDKNLSASYLKAIKGIAIEELFYDEKGKANNYRIENLKKLPKDKKIIVSEFVKNKNNIYKVIQLNQTVNFYPLSEQQKITINL
jgi:cysteinyl-tRNA synthetase